MSVVRISRPAIVLFVLFAVACRGELQQDPGNIEVRVALQNGALSVLDIKDVGELPNPPATGQTVAFRFIPEDGAEQVVGEIGDPRILRSEFDRADQPDPQFLVADYGIFGVRLPTARGRLELERDGELLGSLDIDPDAPVTRTSALMRQADVLGGPVKIVDHGPSSEKADILFLPEGYTEAELDRFHAHVDTIVQNLSSHSGYRDHWTGFNVWRQDVRSRWQGTGSGGRAIDTAFDTARGVAGLERCVFFTNPAGEQAARGLARSAGADVTVVLVNDTDRGGCAVDGLVVSSRPRNVADVVAHELGHGLFGLADEYESARTSGHCSAGPNVAIGPRLNALPWADMVNTSELPTSPSASFGTIGAFEGGGYCSYGRWRPTHNCAMRSLGANMCPVCRREMARTLAALAPGSGPDASGVTVTNATGSPLWVKCDGQARPGCSNWNLVGENQSAAIAAPGRRIVLYDGNTAASPVFNHRAVTAPSDLVKIYANASDPFQPSSSTGGTGGTGSNGVSVSAPTNLSPDLAVVDTDSAQLAWSAVGAATRYELRVEVERNGAFSPFVTMNSATPAVTLLLGTEAARYRWRVAACNDQGCRSSHDALFEHRPTQSGTTPGGGGTTAVDITPRNFQPPHEASVTAGDVTLRWDGETGSTYSISVRIADPVSGWVDHFAQDDLTDTRVTVPLDTASTWYAWTVRACNANGCSAWPEYALVYAKP